jgi:hypothetical protein
VPCLECELEEQQQQEELELVVEINDMNSMQEEGESNKKSYVATMGPMVGGEENSFSDNNCKDSQIMDNNNAETNDSGDDRHLAAADQKNEAATVSVAADCTSEAATPEAAAVGVVENGIDPDEEVSSESDYAKEEEPEVGADAHLMADIKFSQQKLHELLNQLEKQNRFPATSSSSSSSPASSSPPPSTAAADTEAEKGSEEAEPKSEEVVGDKETSPLPSPKESTPAAEEAAEDKSAATPERRMSGDQEISDHIDRAKLRKCSSLKSGRTPPGTPGVRKIVRYII